MLRLRKLLNWKQPAICTPMRGQYRLHTGGAARQNCTSMAPQMRLMQVRSGAVSPCPRRMVPAPAAPPLAAVLGDYIALKVCLKRDQSKTLDELKRQLETSVFWKACPPGGMEVASWCGMMPCALLACAQSAAAPGKCQKLLYRAASLFRAFKRNRSLGHSKRMAH
jgi:hypothetical protein